MYISFVDHAMELLSKVVVLEFSIYTLVGNVGYKHL